MEKEVVESSETEANEEDNLKRKELEEKRSSEICDLTIFKMV